MGSRQLFVLRDFQSHVVVLGIVFATNLCAAQSVVDWAEKMNWGKAELALQQGADPDRRQADGMTAAHWAAYHGAAKFLERLHSAGANLDSRTIYSITPLSLAAEHGHAGVVEVLLKAKPQIESRRMGRETALMLAARHGNADVVRSLITAGAKVDAREVKGQTALMWAAAEGNVEAVDALIHAGADIDYSLKKSGFSAFMFACRQGNVDSAMRLLDAGFDVNKTMTTSRTGGRNPRSNMSGLMLAIESGHLEFALKLIERGADPNDERSGFAPLHAITWVRKTQVGDNPAGDPAPRITGSHTTLQFVRELVTLGADVNLQLSTGNAGKARLNPKGATPFLLASATADLPLMKLLLELGANPKLTNADGCNALMAAAGVGVTAVGEEPGTEEEVAAAIELLNGCGIGLDTVDKNGETAMHGAAYRTYPKIVRLLSQLGADANVWNRKNKHGWTPRTIAAGSRPGSVKPSPETVAAIDEALATEGR